MPLNYAFQIKRIKDLFTLLLLLLWHQLLDFCVKKLISFQRGKLGMTSASSCCLWDIIMLAIPKQKNHKLTQLSLLKVSSQHEAMF